MSDKQPPLTKRLQWRAECLVISLVEGVASLMPGYWVFRFGERIAAVAWRLMPRRRNAVIRNLRIAFAGEKDLPEIRRMAKASFIRTGGNLLSVAHTAKLSRRQLEEVLEVENMELMERALARGRGVVLLLSHMGNWELLSRLIHLLPEGTRIGGMYRPLNNIYMDKRVRARREADGSRMFSKRDPFHQITGFLRDGGVVGVLVDQRVGIKGDVVRFFGRTTKASPLPALLARRSKSDVLALSMATEQPGKWKATLLPVESPATTSHCMSALESAMMQSPEDVFWLQERWELRLGPRFGIGDLYGEHMSREDKGHRALVWLKAADDFSGLSQVWQHADVNYEVVLEGGRMAPEGFPEDVRLHRIEAGVLWRDELRRIDGLETLPLDFVLGLEQSDQLEKACAGEGIPYYIHDQIGLAAPIAAKRRQERSEASGS